MKKRDLEGFTLMEVLVAGIILTVALLGTLNLLSRSLNLSGNCRNSTIAMYALEEKMEELKAVNYQTLKADYTESGSLKETSFELPDTLDGMGVIYASELPGLTNSLLRIKTVICYRQNIRVIGEDTNLNGALDDGEDVNGNGELDSPYQIESVVLNSLE